MERLNKLISTIKGALYVYEHNKTAYQLKLTCDEPLTDKELDYFKNEIKLSHEKVIEAVNTYLLVQELLIKFPQLWWLIKKCDKKEE